LKLCRDLTDWSFRDRWIVVDETSEKVLTISRISFGVQDVLVPKLIQVIAPWCQRSAGTKHQQIEEPSIFVLGAFDTVGWPAMSPGNAIRNRGQIQGVDHLALLPEHRLSVCSKATSRLTD
jgi:hypothetical protein